MYTTFLQVVQVQLDCFTLEDSHLWSDVGKQDGRDERTFSPPRKEIARHLVTG